MMRTIVVQLTPDSFILLISHICSVNLIFFLLIFSPYFYILFLRHNIQKFHQVIGKDKQSRIIYLLQASMLWKYLPVKENMEHF